MSNITTNTAEKLADAMRALGFEVEVTHKEYGYNNSYFEDKVTIANPMPKATGVKFPMYRFNDADRVLLTGTSLGVATIKGDKDTTKRYAGYNQAEYSHWTKVPKKIGYDYTTASEEALIANMRRYCTMPTQAQYDAALERAKAEMSKSNRWDRERKISSLAAKHGKRAMEVLLEANVEIPEDLREAMAEFMDLQGGA
jgi:hypothetical protein